ncbi:MAG: OPT family oligopeptide transporter [Candidatus Eremiobacteraeota bacterium]|nr:OPT family oligopeptide transporter [Candidatus Eremiobacteraeota bacterium]
MSSSEHHQTPGDLDEKTGDATDAGGGEKNFVIEKVPSMDFTGMSPDEIENYWVKHIYKGDKERQLTFRSVLMGMLLGGIMSLSNLYVGLKTGWGIGVAITSCILAFSIFKALQRLLPFWIKQEFTVLENNMMQSAASAAGYMTSAGLVSAIPALMMLTGQTMSPLELILWLAAVSFLGCIMAIPMKRQMINVEQLKFPSGIAAAETLQSMHAHGGEAALKARTLGLSAIVGVLVAWFRDGKVAWMKGLNIPGMFPLPFSIFGVPCSKLTIGFEGSLIMIGAGAIIGLKVTISMLAGAVINYILLAPFLIKSGVIKEAAGYREIVKWSLWPGVALMLTSSLVTFALNWKVLARAFKGLGAMFGGARKGDEDPIERVESPMSWFIIGVIVVGAYCVYLQTTMFQIHWWMGVLAVLLSFVLSIVACRASGETDINPIGAMGKITQLTYGVIAPGNVTANLMTASITSGAASHSADLLSDLKSGYILGANARMQFIAQFFGIIAGALFSVPVYNLLVPNASVLGTDKIPAPAAQVWKGVAELLSKGIESLPPSALFAVKIAAVLGVALALLEWYVPKSRKYLPSAAGLGMAFVIPFFNSFSMFIGAVIAYLYHRYYRSAARMYTIPISSGLIAGESLMGIVIAALTMLNIIR